MEEKNGEGLAHARGWILLSLSLAATRTQGVSLVAIAMRVLESLQCILISDTPVRVAPARLVLLAVPDAGPTTKTRASFFSAFLSLCCVISARAHSPGGHGGLF